VFEFRIRRDQRMNTVNDKLLTGAFTHANGQGTAQGQAAFRDADAQSVIQQQAS
jgi:hypothetical protein